MNDLAQTIVKQPDGNLAKAFVANTRFSFLLCIFPEKTGWNELWRRDIHPWDKSTPSPALVEVIEKKPIKDQIPQAGNVLVPGCGRGVDVFYLGNEHRKAYGLDISPIAVEQCKEIRSKKNIPESQAEFMVGDFFKFDIPAGGFQLIYDYTFFCAIQPELRPDWGRRMGELVSKDGILITLMFPLGDHTDGPPFAVSVEAYHKFLDANFDCLLVDDCTSFEARQGKEKIGWNELWEQDFHPWTKETPSPALVEIIEQKPIKDQIPQAGNVLVPGCGRGIDVFYLGNERRKAYGLDISPIAIQQCKDIRDQKGIPESQAEFLTGDFFTFDLPAGGFQLVYDYTFFCAIQPELRPAWGRRMAELVSKDGVLITLMYPLGDHTDGPPFAVSVDTYHHFLNENFECLLVDDCTSFEVRKGKEKISVWRRK
ncbi:hypothetical protein BGZ83_005556 [Gryganskiella cystojenkinii]|nr:hypothetical protein BGZ83_005556 [Gryganskiella cystojenkinii]